MNYGKQLLPGFYPKIENLLLSQKLSPVKPNCYLNALKDPYPLAYKRYKIPANPLCLPAPNPLPCYPLIPPCYPQSLPTYDINSLLALLAPLPLCKPKTNVKLKVKGNVKLPGKSKLGLPKKLSLINEILEKLFAKGTLKAKDKLKYCWVYVPVEDALELSKKNKKKKLITLKKLLKLKKLKALKLLAKKFVASKIRTKKDVESDDEYLEDTVDSEESED